jgi:uncharacterized protein YceK
MKISSFTLLVVLLVVAALVCAGCSSVKSSSPASTGNQGTAAASGGAAASGSGGSCPAVTPATSWTGKWVSWGYSDPCFDARIHFYPATADNPTPWESTVAGVMDFPVTFTQTGCDVTGSITVGPNGTLVAQPGCPITLTGKVDKTGAVAGTWHAYCNINLNGATSSDGTTDSGSWSLNMEPGGSTFIGSFGVPAADLTTYKSSESCDNANSNWVGKRG